VDFLVHVHGENAQLKENGHFQGEHIHEMPPSGPIRQHFEQKLPNIRKTCFVFPTFLAIDTLEKESEDGLHFFSQTPTKG
jgi:hypothetical protein